MNWKYCQPKFEYLNKSRDMTRGWFGHINFAYDLLSNVKPDVVVELGTHNGTSFFSMCQAIKDNRLTTKIYAVDTWRGDLHASRYDETIFEGVSDIKNAYYLGINPVLLRKTFDEALCDFQDESIDILHIDGFHTYEAVKHDFETWVGKVKKNGIILFHDTHEKREGFGVYKLWEELKGAFKTTEFQHSHGLGVLFKGVEKYNKLTQFEKDWRIYYPTISNFIEIDPLQNGKNEQLRMLEEESSRLRQEIKTMKDSKFWKLRNFYLKIKSLITQKNA